MGACAGTAHTVRAGAARHVEGLGGANESAENDVVDLCNGIPGNAEAAGLAAYR